MGRAAASGPRKADERGQVSSSGSHRSSGGRGSSEAGAGAGRGRAAPGQTRLSDKSEHRCPAGPPLPETLNKRLLLAP